MRLRAVETLSLEHAVAKRCPGGTDLIERIGSLHGQVDRRAELVAAFHLLQLLFERLAQGQPQLSRACRNSLFEHEHRFGPCIGTLRKIKQGGERLSLARLEVARRGDVRKDGEEFTVSL